MIPGPICKPDAHRRPRSRASVPESGGVDAFSFAAASPDAQSMRNMMTVFAAPWAAMWAMQMEMSKEIMRHAFGG